MDNIGQHCCCQSCGKPNDSLAVGDDLYNPFLVTFGDRDSNWGFFIPLSVVKRDELLTELKNLCPQLLTTGIESIAIVNYFHDK